MRIIDITKIYGKLKMHCFEVRNDFIPPSVITNALLGLGVKNEQVNSAIESLKNKRIDKKG